MTFRIGVLTIVIALFLAGNFYAQQELVIKNGVENYPIGKHLSFFEDKEGKLNIDEVASDSIKNKFALNNKESLNFGYSESVFWLRFVIVDSIANNVSGMFAFQNLRNWIIVKNEQILEDIRTYYKDQDAGKYIEIKAGSAFPVDEKVIQKDEFIARIKVLEDLPDTVFIRIQSKSPLIISFNLLSPGYYVKQSSLKYLFQGILFGIFFLLMAYNILFYFAIKDKVYLYYVLYIAFFALFIFTFQGLYLEFFGRNFNQDYFKLPLSTVTIAGIFWLLLTREFLSTKLYMPWAYKILTYLTFFPIILLVSIFALKIPKLALFLSLYLLCSYIVGLLITIIAVKKRIYLSKYYLISTGGIAVFIFVSLTTRNNLLPISYNFWTQNSLSLGILWEALIIAATVGFRYNHLRAEKEREKGLIRAQIAADLHDEIGSNLSTISLQSRLMMNEQNLDSNIRMQLKDISKIAVSTSDTIRDIVWFINPFHDKSEDLFFRMKELASKMLSNLDYNFNTTKKNENIFDRLPDLNRRRHVYLIYKEILNNIIKHSDAKKVDILLTVKNKKIVLIVSDNGKGFSESEIKPGEGLKNLRNRATLAGAQIFIESNGGEGTKITLEVPL